VTLAYLEYDRHGRIAGLHHTSFQFIYIKNPTEISEMLKIVVGTENGRTQFLSVSPSSKVA
jgi:hypothetical protein